jgi:hypothetical protein
MRTLGPSKGNARAGDKKLQTRPFGLLRYCSPGLDF